uniref:Nad-dependent dehydratase n=1 Tax=Tetraselmis sp. GSL018 TaxID=582737 RepID=A0A061SCR3_9CHLO|eukprot:CAMPEP_0177594570 /NCGR_PEP_ID=MMETSP0419_2-20121207/9853_1 /TAXON_ID=582737 /ORGANISM="Tetraselmis sp., Strain GSL018" /LENGTH=360 /DNA_ID=CAMNT_0019085891 /DNA_START=1 /DNA_END=1083 /DNA_ORIENTATION=-
MSDSTSQGNIALVVGKGVIGRSVVEYLDSQPQAWAKILILATSEPSFQTRAQTLKVDLLSEQDAEEKLGYSGSPIKEVTHVFYCGLAPGGTDDVEKNVAMFRNVLNIVDRSCPSLKRVLLNEGLKYYGVHLGKFKTPAKEDDPRVLGPMFYYDQEDLLKEKAKDKSWGWVAIRPDVVCGYAFGQMNLVVVIAVYCVICKELGLPLRFPGKPSCFDKLAQVCYAPHLAKACEWAATSDKAEGEAFNVVNGDFFRWETVWPKFAKYFGMDWAGVGTVSLSSLMSDKGTVWDGIVRKYGLKPHKLENLCVWGFGDWCFGAEFDVMADTSKIRRAGFTDTVDSEEMFFKMFDEFKAMGIIPKYE